ARVLLRWWVRDAPEAEDVVVDVDHAGDDGFAGGVDHLGPVRHRHFPAGPDRRDPAILDDDGAVLDDLVSFDRDQAGSPNRHGSLRHRSWNRELDRCGHRPLAVFDTAAINRPGISPGDFRIADPAR